MTYLLAQLRTESGRANKAIIAPRTVREITIASQEWPPGATTFFICSLSALYLHGIWVAGGPLVIRSTQQIPTKIPLYNGGLESCYIEHEQPIAQLVSV